MVEITTYSPRTVRDAHGTLEAVMLNYDEYRALLRLLARHTDRNELPEPLQDAIDEVLVDEATGNTQEPLTFASLRGIWAGVDISDDDIEASRIKIPEDLL